MRSRCASCRRTSTRRRSCHRSSASSSAASSRPTAFKAAGGAGTAGTAGGYAAVEAKRAQFAAISRELNQIFFQFPFTVPEYFALITRALIVLEGIALSATRTSTCSKPPTRSPRAAVRLFGSKEVAKMMQTAAVHLPRAARARMIGDEATPARPPQAAAAEPATPAACRRA